MSSTWPDAGGCKRIRRLFVVLAIVAAASTVHADGEQVGVSEAGGVYTVAATFTVAQAPSDAMAVLTDYNNLARFMPGLRRSITTARAGARVTVEQEADAKLLAFSKRVSLLLEIDESPLALQFKDTSGKSFLRYQGSWRLSVQDGRTVIAYALVAKPGFAVPAFVLTRLLKRDSTRMIAALQTEIAARAR